LLFTVLALTLFMVGGLQFVGLAEANPLPVSLLKMPEEYVNYTITRVNGSLWAKVDGTYPLIKFDIECQDQLLWTNNTWFTFSGDALPMVYPTPPGTTNISLKMNETELKWSNYTQSNPDALHHTALGDWSMISSTITVLDHFTLKIHYEHPIGVANENNTFLYDLNISPYLSPWSNKSTAHFNIRFETKYTDLQANTIAANGALNPVNYELTEEDETEGVTLQVVSECYKPLLGDLLISFTESEETEQANSASSGSSLTIEYAFVAAMLIAIVVIAGGLSLKRRREIEER
jgi:hypothetical protein